MTLLPFIHNVALLISMVMIYSLMLQWFRKESLRLRLISGVLFGLVTMVGMMSALEIREGIFFDGRSVILGLAGLFGGPIVAGVAMVIALAYRIWAGGAGMTMGVMIIITSPLLGIVHYKLKERYPAASSPAAYLILGFAIHIAMIFYSMLLPGPVTWEILPQITFPVLVILPLSTMLLALLFESRVHYLNINDELRKERRLLRTLIDNMPATVYVKDKDLRKVLANKAEMEMLEKTEDEVIGKTDRELYPPEIAARFEADDKRVLQYGEEITNQEEEFTNSRGETTWLLTSKTPLLDHDGQISGLIGVGQDITEKVDTIKELEKAKESAEKANKSKSEFLANMSHEIRTPMNAILGFSETLYERIDDPGQKKMLQSVLSSGKLLLTLLNDILDLSKVEAGKMEIVPVKTDMEEMIREMKMLYEPRAREKGLMMRTIFPETFPDNIKLDEVRVKQILFNLVGNAVKFTRQGQVLIQIDFIPCNQTQGELVISVTDTGTGISEKEQEYVFQPFYQQDGQPTRRHGGSGLGLAITKRLVERMHGRIEVESRPGKGSRFKVSIPGLTAGEEASQKSPSDKDTGSIHFDPATVMIVDDVSENLELFEVMLTGTGLQVLKAQGGHEALDMLQTHQPDLIVLDILMPDIDGYHLAKKIREDARFRNTPLIAFTAYLHDKPNNKQAGLFDDRLHKPIKRKELLRTLGRYLGHTQKPGENREKLNKGDSSPADPAEVEAPIALPQETRQQLPHLLDILHQQYMSDWEKIKDHWVLFKIEDFALQLRKFGANHRLDTLTAYADQLLSAIDSLDLEQIKEILGAFPETLQKLEDYNTG
ncbi:MAG: ATP-binding protein [Bacteroidales bacterium]